MKGNFRFILNRLLEKLWVKPLIFCIISIGGALIAHFADDTFLSEIVPEIEQSSLEDLISTISDVMLVIAIFAVGSMLSAFSAASDSATPRSFELIVADDVSQNALSVYIGSFIFSIVAGIALKNGFYGEAGNFVLFILTIIVFALVILTFLRWVDQISKLGRLGHTIKKVEDATKDALKKRIAPPLLGGIPVKNRKNKGTPVYSSQIGYIQHINMDQLQELAEEAQVHITLNGLPGTFLSPDNPLLWIISSQKDSPTIHEEKIQEAFIIDNQRSFHDDPRFGLITLSEIASRALSPGINDPGTAIAILGSHVRLFVLWLTKDNDGQVKYNRIEVPELVLSDLLDDAFRPIARDGANNIEVMLRMQKAFTAIASVGSNEVKDLILSQSLQAYNRAAFVMEHKEDLALLKATSFFTNQ